MRTKQEEAEWQEAREKLMSLKRPSCKDCKTAYPWQMGCGYEHRGTLICPAIADAILALKEIQVTSKDQTAPGPQYPNTETDAYIFETEQGMKQAGFLKVLPKE
jgi:hypothetical protein